MPRLYGTSNNGSYIYVDYVIGNQNLVDNYTDVSWTVGVHWGSYYFNIHDAVLKVGTTYGSITGSTGSGVYNSGWPISGAGTNKDWPFWNGSTRVWHDVNGNGNITFNASAWWDTPAYFKSTLSATVALAKIPRYPNPPSTPAISNIASTSVYVTFKDGSSGTPIDARQIGYGTNSTSPTTLVSSDGSDTVSGLTPGTVYYFWAREHNTAGWSAWSGRASATTLRVSDAPSNPVISDITQLSVVATFSPPPSNGGATVTGYQIGYSTNSTGPTTLISASSPQTITGLSPATTYFFWVRAQNSVGWSSWSGSTMAKTIAGAFVKVGTVWKEAIPYVRVSGVWKVARPWARIAGVWKETT